jgi:8-oxo-dGTP diphosphatase
MLADEVNFCPRCGTPVVIEEHFGQQRPACPTCGWIYFADPKVAVAGLIEKDGQVLLVRRAIDPRRGLWTLPAGFVDAGEDPARAMEREFLEETGLQVRVTRLLDVVFGQEHPRGAHIIIFYRVQWLSGEFQAGDDVDRIAYFPIDQLPPLAFSNTESIIHSII